ncbi:histidine phosphatase family protein [Butyrivibrio sp. AE3004]|uniref:histidine phosphatase family protein n=1 Tax=Butyrivibrio sp. AE3004 TaxID=1506994 RepID=UPI0004949A52|nr:histidine phosphatase family protein [Butyrivibrio sp. AE3004]
MRLLFIRHGDPNYTLDNLTDKGKIEAELLAKQIENYGIDDIYMSPLGRAKATAEYSLKVLGKEATVCDWLMEFPALFDANTADDETRLAYPNELKLDETTGKYDKRIVWDIMPSYYANHSELFDVVKWRESKLVKNTNMIETYDHVILEFDKMLSDYGYERNGNVYRVRQNNENILGLFCHFGITSVLLSHLWSVSPFITMQFLAMAPTSVTEIVTEEREKGIAIFRTLRIGDTTHLTMGKEPPSFSARFCERFENDDERH